jgi:hypothetical protein
VLVLLLRLCVLVAQALKRARARALEGWIEVRRF